MTRRLICRLIVRGFVDEDKVRTEWHRVDDTTYHDLEVGDHWGSEG